MRLCLRHALTVVPLLYAVACASGPRPAYMEPPRPRERVERLDVVPEFVATVRAELETGRVQDAWQQYDVRHRALLEPVGALAADPRDEQRVRLIASIDAVLQLSAAFEREAARTLDALLQRFVDTLGSVPRIWVVFAVAVPDRTVFSGEREGRPLRLFNARHPELGVPSRRQAVLARELFRVWHTERAADSPSLGAVASRVYREGAVAFAARQLAPDAGEADVLELTDAQLSAARKRERLIAQELLASIDSASTAEAARFFDPAVKDPLVPPGGGVFISDRLYQRLAAELGSATRPLLLTPQDFLSRARKHLLAMASARD